MSNPDKFKFLQLKRDKDQSALLSRVWGRCEKARWISRCHYRCSLHRSEKRGVIMVTRGAVYIYRRKLLKGFRLRYCFSPLKCFAIEQSQNVVIFTLPPPGVKQGSAEEVRAQNNLLDDMMDDNDNQELLEHVEEAEDVKIRVETTHADKLVLLLVRLIQNAVFGVKDAPVPEMKLDVEPVPPQERPKQCLKRRAMMLGHLFVDMGIGLDVCNYFQAKWDGGPILTLGHTFHPSIFGPAFGRAVGWETLLNTVVFRTVKFSHFPEMCDEMLRSAQTIERVVFLDYKRSMSLSFNFSRILGTSVKRWWFLNTCARVVSPFLGAANRLPSPIEEFVLAKYSYNRDDASDIFHMMKRSPNITGTRNVKLVNLNFSSFPMDDFSRLVNKFHCLQMLYMKNINVDGNQLLVSICRGRGYLRQVSLLKMNFAEPIPMDLEMPDGLVVLDVSKSKFIGVGMAALLSGITSTMAKNPFVFIARKIQVTESEYVELGRMDVSKCQPNLLELNYSNNNIVTVGFDQFFEWIRTQTRMRELIFDDIVTDESPRLVAKLVWSIRSIELHGLELGVRFDPLVMNILLSTLATVPSLTRFCMKNCGLGIEGLKVMTSLLKVLPSLTELSCDGFRPAPMTEEELHAQGLKLHPLLTLWRTVYENQHITRTDFPHHDLATAQIDISKLRMREKSWLTELQQRQPTTTQQERVAYLLNKPYQVVHSKAGVDDSYSEYEYEFITDPNSDTASRPGTSDYLGDSEA